MISAGSFLLRKIIFFRILFTKNSIFYEKMHKKCKNAVIFLREWIFFCTFAPEIQKRTIMLKKFAVTNFRGFANRIEWDLSNPSNYEFSQYAIKDGIIKNAIIYGPNGSGKSNFSFAMFDIVNHLTQKHKEPNFYVNFPYASQMNMPVTFEYAFQFGEDQLEYVYTKDRNGNLLTEDVDVNGVNMIHRQEKKIECDSSLMINKGAIEALLKENDNKVSVISFLLVSIPLSSTHYLIKLRDFVNSMLWFRNLDERGFIGLQTSTTILEEYIIQNGYVEEFAKFLNDISGQQFDFSLTKAEDKYIMCRIDDIAIPFNLLESTGTRSLKLLFYWITNLKDASLVFVDEFDAFYHFKLAYEVCRRLFALDNCQVFMTSHNTYLMTNDLLRPDCNFILDNNKIKPLNQCTDKELRFGHNMEKLFRGNTFKV